MTRTITLGALFPDIKIGGTPPRANAEYFGGGLPWVSIRDLSSGKVIEKTNETLSELGVRNSNVKKISKGSLLFSFKLTVGKVAFAGTELYTNEAIAAFEHGNPDVLLEYLYYCLPIYAKRVSRTNNYGAPLLNKEVLKELEIPLPSIEEQREIVSKLDKISELIAMKKKSIEKTESLTQSVFLEMFLETPAKKQKMSEVVERIQIGPFGTQLHFSDYTDGGIPLINPINLKNGKIVPDFSNTIRLEKASSLPEYLLKEGDLIMGRRGEMGRCALVTSHENGWFCGTGSLYIRTSGTINGLYLSYLLGTDEYVKILENESRGATMANLNKRIISELLIPIPSQEALKTFDMIHENSLRIFYGQKKSLSILESLYDATAQKFFSHNTVTTNG